MNMMTSCSLDSYLITFFIIEQVNLAASHFYAYFICLSDPELGT
jgi:hypothetical protein